MPAGGAAERRWRDDGLGHGGGWGGAAAADVSHRSTRSYAACSFCRAACHPGAPGPPARRVARRTAAGVCARTPLPPAAGGCAAAPAGRTSGAHSSAAVGLYMRDRSVVATSRPSVLPGCAIARRPMSFRHVWPGGIWAEEAASAPRPRRRGRRTRLVSLHMLASARHPRRPTHMLLRARPGQTCY